MTEAVETEVTARARAKLFDEAARALDTLDGAIGKDTVLEMRSADVVRTMSAELRRALEREGATIALIGERENGALLDAWLGRSVFGDLSLVGPGPTIALRAGPNTTYRAILRGGAAEEFDTLVPDRDAEIRAEAGELAVPRSDPSIPISLEMEIPPAANALAPRRSWVQRLLDWLLALFGKKAKVEAPPPTVAPPKPALAPAPAREGEQTRVMRRRREHREERERELVRRVAELATTRAEEVTEIGIVHPMNGASMTLLDLRGELERDAEATWKRVKTEVDQCILVLEQRSSVATMAFRTTKLARELSKIAPHLWAVCDGTPDALAAALKIDAARVVCLAPPLEPHGLAEKVLDERALTTGVRVIAALRVAQQGIEEHISAEESRDRVVLERLASYAVPAGNKRRDDTHRKVSGAVAGRAARILQSVIAVLEAELGVVRDERERAVSSAKSMEALKAEVQAVGPTLRALRTKLAGYAESMVHEAMSELGPSLLEDVERRLATAQEDLSHAKIDRPVWPAAPRVAVPEDGLVAHATLAGGETLRADIRWADSFLRSLPMVKQRVAQQLAQDLEQLSNAAQAEILDFEPQIARRLQESLELWVNGASDTFNAWLDRAIAEERKTLDALRTERLSGLVTQRDALQARGQRMGELNRALNTRSRNARLSEAPPPLQRTD